MLDPRQEINIPSMVEFNTVLTADTLPEVFLEKSTAMTR